LAGGDLHIVAAGLPCTIGYRGGQWHVTVAEVVYADDPVLSAAIVQAFCGHIERVDALELAKSIESQKVSNPR
jgi:hypothetical protein